jgi:riboflavin kinase / FMN adenylyltransferase
MPHYRSLEEGPLPVSRVTIGSFDGVHRGHRALIQHLVAEAQQNHAPAAVVTFFPHPAVVLRGLQQPYYLTSPEERARLILALRVDSVYTLDFNPALAALEGRAFVDLLNQSIHPQKYLIGADFVFGHNRSGNPELLKTWGNQIGFDVETFLALQYGEEKISSRTIRTKIESGEVQAAADLLGRAYRIEGKIVTGDMRGRGLGFPTANLEVWPQQLLPANGVYATTAWVDGQPHLSVTNLGLRPTFDQDASVRRVEAHILDFAQDIYGKTIQLDFIDYIRPEKKFSAITELVNQINQDIVQAREVTRHAPPTTGISA